MKKTLLLFGLLLASCIPAHAWSLTTAISTGAPASCSTCNLTVTSTGAGHLGIAVLINDGGGGDTTITSVSDGTTTFATCSPTCHATINNRSIDAAYILSSNSGKTTITFTLSRASTYQFAFVELTPTGAATLNTGATPICTNTRSSTTPVNCSTTITGSTNVNINAMMWQGSLTGDGAYTNGVFPNANGVAILLNTSSGTGASWTPTTSNSGCSVGLTFAEGSTTAPTQVGGFLTGP